MSPTAAAATAATPEGPDALQVLLADPNLLKLLRTAIADPGQFLPRGEYGTAHPEPITSWSARAVREALRRISDAPRPEGHTP